MSDLDFSGLEVAQAPFKVMLTDPRTGADLLIVGGDRDGEQAFIEVHGYNSKAGEPFRKKAILKAAQKGRSGKTNAADFDPDKLRAENADMVSALTESWLLCSLTGAPIEMECTRSNARALYAHEPTAWIVRQVLEALAEEVNFIQA